MSEENKPLFREKSKEYIDSPEKLDQYLHVTSPGVWVSLAAVIVLLLGVIGWSIFGRLESHVPVAVIRQGAVSVCIVPETALEAAVRDCEVVVDGVTMELAPDALIPLVIDDTTNVYVRLAGEYQVGDIVYEIPLKTGNGTPAEDGIYKGSITTETISPMHLLLN